MLRRQQVVTGREQLARKHLCPLTPTYNLHRKYGSTGDIEFDFWGVHKTSCPETDNRDEFQFQAQIDRLGASSPPLWKENTSRISTYESSPLLPHDHQFSNFSPQTRSQAIAEGRRELMEMIHGMPEGNYELSLQDIVDEPQHALQEVKEQMADQVSSSFRSEVETKKPEKKKSCKSGEISRSGSMDNETFLIKMFLPTSLGSRNKAKTKHRSKVSPRASFEISENHNDREKWIRRSSAAGKNKSNGKLSNGCFNKGNSSRNRQDDGNFSSGCLPFFRTKKSKSWSLRGCIF